MPSYRSPSDRTMDILYLLLPIIGAFILLFLVCCFGRKVKDMLHFPKELVLGRHFPGLASSTTSSRSSLSDFGHYDRGRTDDVDDEGPTIIVNVSSEHQRVLNQRHRARHHYSQVPSTEVFSFQQNSSSIDFMPSREASTMQLPRISISGLKEHKSHHQYKRSDSCPLMSDFRNEANALEGLSLLGHAHALPPFKLHPGYLQCHGNLELDSDSDIPDTVSRPSSRHRHRSNSDSDILRCLNSESEDYFSNNRFSQFSHKLASTEIQLHAPVGSEIAMECPNEPSLNYQAEVG